ncbi:FG-GAP repeat domain-containing protein [Dactylosporangium sp. NPDC051541]|uniref:FG-GAP repeat domain-containing protein n=1 Tax=Dactylosporangium sp. NPDC051541 TaxID=3363977 RepID=UPI003787546C
MRIRRLGLAAVALGLAAAMATGGPASASGAYSFAGVTDWDKDGNQDIIARDPGGDLWLFPGEGTRAVAGTQPVQIGLGWNGYTFTGLADWDNDGNQDIIARNVAGDLLMFPGDSARATPSAAPVQIGLGWNGYAFAGIADWDKDGNQDIVARSLNGDLWLFPGQAVRGYSTAAPVQIGTGWNGYDFAGITDWDKDGNQDIIVRGTTGDLSLFPGESVRGYSSQPPVLIGTGWNGYDFAGAADWDNDGNADVIARKVNNDLWLFPGDSTRGVSGQTPVEIGSGW